MEMELFVVLIFVIIIVFGISKASIKGWFGEKAVGSILERLPKEEYRVINGIMLQTENGTCQIDHVVISIYGIFVIETKNYKGWITGSEYGDQWTKNVYGKKYQFRNPIKQNYGHVKVLEKYLELPFEKFIPIVAFSSAGELKTEVKSNVIYISQLAQFIQQYKVVQINESKLDMLYGKLCHSNISSIKNQKKHVQKIRTNIALENKKIRDGICPKCGGTLVKRNGKYGTFWGCSNYPQCRYTKK